LTEATVAIAHATPTVVPVVAKAAVGIGLAAAVFTPTADSAVHLAAEALVSAPVVAETDAEVPPIGEAIVQENLGIGQEVATGESSEGPDTAIAMETVSPSRAQPVVIPGPSSSEEIVVEQPSVAITTGITGTMTTSGFVAQRSAEGQYDLSGDVRFVVGGITVVGGIDAVSRIQIGESADGADPRRIEALIVASNQNGTSLAEIRLVGFVASETMGASRISGLFRTESEELDLLSGGAFSGTLELGSQTESGSLDIQFTQ